MSDQVVDGYIHRPDGSRAMKRCDGSIYEMDPPTDPKFLAQPDEIEEMCKYMASKEDPDIICDAFHNALVRDGWTFQALAREVEKYLR